MTITHESHVTITADGLQTWVHWTWPHFRWSKSTNFGLTHLSYFILYPMIQWKISSPNKQKAILHTSPHWTWLKHSNSLNSLNLKIAETCGHTNPIPIIPVMSQWTNTDFLQDFLRLGRFRDSMFFQIRNFPDIRMILVLENPETNPEPWSFGYLGWFPQS